MEEGTERLLVVHCVSDRGIVWRVGNQLVTRCLPEDKDESVRWHAATKEHSRGIWGLDEVELEDNGRYRLQSRYLEATALLEWSKMVGAASPRRSAVLNQARDLVRQFPTATELLVDGGDQVWLPLVPWMQCIRVRSTREELEGLLGIELARVDLVPTGSTCLTQANGGSAADESQSSADLAQTQEIPKLNLPRGRLLPMAMVSILATTAVMSLAWWRWGATTTECPPAGEVLTAVEKIMAGRAAAIEQGNLQMLGQVEAGEVLAQDRQMVASLREDGWQLSNLAFEISEVQAYECGAEGVTLTATISQGSFTRCRKEECQAMATRGPVGFRLGLSPDKDKIVSMERSGVE